MRFVVVSLAILFADCIPAAAQEAVYLIRHAEKELSGDDPALTSAGRERAAAWAVMLRHAGIDAVITSDALRTRETGEIVANALGLQHASLPRGDVAGLVDVLEFDHEGDTVLIVAHSETIPRILDALGEGAAVSIGQDEFANLFVLVGPSSDEPVLLRLQMP